MTKTAIRNLQLRLLAVSVSITILAGCSTYRPCVQPDVRPELDLQHGVMSTRYPIRSLIFDGKTLAITSICGRAETWCVTLATRDAEAIRELLQSPQLLGEIRRNNRRECITFDTRYFGVNVIDPDGVQLGYGACYDHIEGFPETAKLLARIDEIAQRYFGWRYGHTFTAGPTLLNRLRARGYGCRQWRGRR